MLSGHLSPKQLIQEIKLQKFQILKEILKLNEWALGRNYQKTSI